MARALFVRSQAIWLKAAQDPQTAQLEALTNILQKNQDTAFGRGYGFGQMRSLDQFKSKVPLQTWEDVLPWVNRMLQGEEKVLVSEPFLFMPQHLAPQDVVNSFPSHLLLSKSFESVDAFGCVHYCYKCLGCCVR